MSNFWGHCNLSLAYLSLEYTLCFDPSNRRTKRGKASLFWLDLMIIHIHCWQETEMWCVNTLRNKHLQAILARAGTFADCSFLVSEDVLLCCYVGFAGKPLVSKLIFYCTSHCKEGSPKWHVNWSYSKSMQSVMILTLRCCTVTYTANVIVWFSSLVEYMLFPAHCRTILLC